MVTIHINKEVGYTVDAIPDRVYDLIREIDQGADGSLQLKVLPEDERSAIRLLSNGSRPNPETPLRISRHRNTTRISLRVMEEDTQDEDEVQVRRCEDADEPAEAANQADAAPEEAVRAEAAEMPVEEADDEAPAPGVPTEEAVEEDDTVDPPADLAIKLDSGMIGPSDIPADIKIERESVYAAIARLLEDDSTNRAKQLLETKNQFDKMFRELLIMKRNIKLMEHDVQEHPIIKSIIDQIEEVKRHKLINDVYFTDKQIIIITEPLITDDEIEGERRLVGTMRIGIALSAFFSPKALTDVDSVITIHNLTHRYNTGSRIWECGHVDSNGSKCIGNTYDFLFEAFVERNLEYIAESLLRFLTSPNESDSWGAHMKNWKIAEEVDP